jgi:hypothetical protein
MDKRTRKKTSTIVMIVVPIIVALIGAAALVAAPIVSSSVSQAKAQPTVIAVPPTGLEAELSKANIILSEVDRAQVQEWLISDPQYQTMARSVLTALTGNRVVDPIPLDTVVAKYRILLGGHSDTNFPSDRYTDIEKAKDALFKTWLERHKDFPQKSFNEIVENIQ